jgi:hypothetical protein
MIELRPTNILLRPDSKRVLVRPFISSDPAKVDHIIDRALLFLHGFLYLLRADFIIPSNFFGRLCKPPTALPTGFQFIHRPNGIVLLALCPIVICFVSGGSILGWDLEKRAIRKQEETRKQYSEPVHGEIPGL